MKMRSERTMGAVSHASTVNMLKLVLLDGLDEVIDPQTRRFVAEQVSALMGEWTPRGVRFALSSRVVGYREAPVTGNAATLTVLDFGEREIHTFVRQWARAFEIWSAGNESPEVLRQAQALENDVMEDVRSNPSVRRLAANPLMLTMLALLRFGQVWASDDPRLRETQRRHIDCPSGGGQRVGQQRRQRQEHQNGHPRETQRRPLPCPSGGGQRVGQQRRHRPEHQKSPPRCIGL